MKNNKIFRKFGSLVLYIASGTMFFLNWFHIQLTNDSLQDISFLINSLSGLGITLHSRFSLLNVRAFLEAIKRLRGIVPLEENILQGRIDLISTIILIIFILLCCALLAAIVGVFRGKRIWGIGMPLITVGTVIASLIATNDVKTILRELFDSTDTLKLTIFPFLAVILAMAGFIVAPNSTGKKSRSAGALIGVGGVYAGSEFVMSDGETLILGRDPATCNIVLNDENISRQHCAVRYSAKEGKYFVTDLSKNGTFSEGGIRLQPQMETALMKGERIFLGNKKDIFRVK